MTNFKALLKQIRVRNVKKIAQTREFPALKPTFHKKLDSNHNLSQVPTSFFQIFFL